MSGAPAPSLPYPVAFCIPPQAAMAPASTSAPAFAPWFTDVAILPNSVSSLSWPDPLRLCRPAGSFGNGWQWMVSRELPCDRLFGPASPPDWAWLQCAEIRVAVREHHTGGIERGRAGHETRRQEDRADRCLVG